MNHKIKTGAVILALSAAVFYAINTPISKFLLNNVTPTFMAAFLYLGAGVGVGIMFLYSKFGSKNAKDKKSQPGIIICTI
ncbi:MAG: EamA family transporter [Peptoniphilaceae bacterium]|nr:EamA family transporter [Peptoniphilaceae bacterium]